MRDFELIRKILLAIEDQRMIESAELSIEGYESEAIQEHCLMLYDAELIEAKKIGDRQNIDNLIINRVTWHGHDFISALRSDTNWNKTKKAIGSTLSAVTFEQLKQYLMSLISSSLHPPIA